MEQQSENVRIKHKTAKDEDAIKGGEEDEDAIDYGEITAKGGDEAQAVINERIPSTV